MKSVPFEDLNQLKSEIKSFLSLKEVFTDPEIRLLVLSEKMNLSTKVVSRFFKYELKIGFNELLNKYRVQFAVDRIEEGYLDTYTLEALGEESGFSSRTTFFNAFKRVEGISPSEYWKNFQMYPN